MKYSIHGFQQDKLIANNLTTEDALILRMIKDLYATSKMEYIEDLGIIYIWVNYSYLFEQIPIIGSKRNLMRKIEKYGNELFIKRILKHEKGSAKGNFSYIAPTEKLDKLEDFDLMTESHKVETESHNPYDESGITLMTESHNKDTSIKDYTITDDSCIKNNNDKSLFKENLKKAFENFRILFPGTKRGLETEFENFTKKNKNWEIVIDLLIPSIKKEIEHKEKERKLTGWSPQFKNMQSWINQKCWEQELPEIKAKPNNNTDKKKYEFEIQAEGKYDNI